MMTSSEFAGALHAGAAQPQQEEESRHETGNE
jgi:hypothetical protein